VTICVIFLNTAVPSCLFQDVDQVTLYSYKVQSTITSRMATTIIQSKLVNNSPQPQNVVFDVQIPKGAFISNFTM
jgi:inter-alpha-trypsin inhibitor heavy chain H2